MTDQWYTSYNIEELRELFMRGAWGVSTSAEAGYRLAFEVESVRHWLLSHGLAHLRSINGIDYVEIDFDACSQRLSSARANPASADLDKSGVAVMDFIASFAGRESINIRNSSNLSRDDARLVAEAVMYASGFMDGTADSTANDGPNGGDGPNAMAHDRRIDELLS